MLVDEVKIHVKAGRGGNGAITFFPGLKTGPSGGDGGNGGSIFVVADLNMRDLNRYAHKSDIVAENGEPGDNFRRHGKHGNDIELQMPVGTTIIDLETGHVVELKNVGDRFRLCQGGRGGRGNDAFKSATYRSPRKAEPGQLGEERNFKIILKLIADYGFIGLPNAGKSSLLNELTAANVKTANYPFTTIEPNLGAIGRNVLADIPGLIEGASQGKGLGFKFLKHIEKVKLLLHCIASDSEDVEQEYLTVRKELETYSAKLAEKDEIILLTKHDLVDEKKMKELMKIFKKYGKKILPVSIHDWDSLEELKKILSK